jgi:AhpC/TSA antioxidant enzyme
LRARYPELQGLGAEVVAVGTGDAGYAQAFVADESIPFPVLVDDGGRAAEAAAVQSSSFIGMLHPRTWAATRETWRRGYRIHRAGKRVTQLGATFVVAPGPGGGARLLYEHLDRDSTDHAPLGEVVAALAPSTG